MLNAYQNCGRLLASMVSPQSTWVTECSSISATQVPTRTMPSGQCALQCRVGIDTGLVLLRHNVSDMRVTVMQHGHRSSFRTSSTISVRRMVEIEFAT